MRRSEVWFEKLRGLRWVVVAIGLVEALAGDRPNIVLIYMDDLGYGDVGCYGARAIPTPNMDRLAREGVRFTQAYATSATCTPSRYGLLTGEYPWRKPGTGILPGNAPLIIEPGRTTVASLLRRAGYRTAVVGKWHLGLGSGALDWNGEIRPGPLEVGFEYAFIMPATNDREPCVYVEHHRVVGLDPSDPIEVSYGRPIPGVMIAREHPELLRMRFTHGHDQGIVNGIPRIGFRKGGTAAVWKDETMAEEFVRRAVAFLEAHHRDPIFLYFALHQPHVPRVPNPKFVGCTALGPRGDVIVEADWCVGEILAALERLGLATRTWVILTSDNGPVLNDGYDDEAVSRNGDHRPAGPLRGGKYSRFEAGTRVPFLSWWPGRIQPGVSDALVSQVDFLATVAELVGVPLAPDDAPDSLPSLAAWLGQSPKGRDHVVVQGVAREQLAIRNERWKLLPPCAGPATNTNTGIELGNAPVPQLYDLAADPGERRNVAVEHPEIVEDLQVQLAKIRSGGYSRPGAGPRSRASSTPSADAEWKGD